MPNAISGIWLSGYIQRVVHTFFRETRGYTEDPSQQTHRTIKSFNKLPIRGTQGASIKPVCRGNQKKTLLTLCPLTIQNALVWSINNVTLLRGVGFRFL